MDNNVSESTITLKLDDIQKARNLLYQLEEQLLVIDVELMDVQMAFMTLRTWLKRKEKNLL